MSPNANLLTIKLILSNRQGAIFFPPAVGALGTVPHFVELGNSRLHQFRKIGEYASFKIAALFAFHSYAGAREMGAISSGNNKSLYERKADDHRRQLANWLRDNITRAFVVRHRDQSAKVTELIAAHRLPLSNVGLRDQIYQLTAALLAPTFAAQYRTSKLTCTQLY